MTATAERTEAAPLVLGDGMAIKDPFPADVLALLDNHIEAATKSGRLTKSNAYYSGQLGWALIRHLFGYCRQRGCWPALSCNGMSGDLELTLDTKRPR